MVARSVEVRKRRLVQYGVQYAYVWLVPWVAQTNASQAHANMVFGQFRYNLP